MAVDHRIFATERVAPGISGGIPSIRRDAEQERCLSTPSARPALFAAAHDRPITAQKLASDEAEHEKDLGGKPMHPRSRPTSQMHITPFLNPFLAREGRKRRNQSLNDRLHLFPR